MTYVRNPNYWKTTLVNGVEYEYPFVDELTMPIIPDESTSMAALRTGKLDYFYDPFSLHWDTLDRLAPELISNKIFGSIGRAIYLRTDEPPFDNLEVRRAMMIGTDLNAFSLLETKTPVPVPWWPIFAGNADPPYTPMEDIPASVQELYVYDPAKARQMLEDELGPADADGLFLKVNYYVLSEPLQLDRAALVEYQWAQIGVEINIIASDRAGHSRVSYDRYYEGALDGGIEVANLLLSLESATTLQWHNYSLFSDAHYDGLISEVMNTIDVPERDRLCKEAALYLMEQMFVIPTNVPPEAAYWWPWVKNYYGEINVADWEGIAVILATAWLDLDLKEDMGY